LLLRGEKDEPAKTSGTILKQKDIFECRKAIRKIHQAEAITEYIVQLTYATRSADKYGKDLAQWIEYGVSPRGSISLERCARAHAWLSGNDFVSPDDIRAVLHDVYRHRLILSFEAEANDVSADAVIDELIRRVPVS
jgi:MoxR-like ATPase